MVLYVRMELLISTLLIRLAAVKLPDVMYCIPRFGSEDAESATMNAVKRGHTDEYESEYEE